MSGYKYVYVCVGRGCTIYLDTVVV